jgi:hypothetical protein
LAQWRTDLIDAAPARVACWSARVHGEGAERVRAWKAEAAGWLAAHPGSRLECGDDLLAILKETVRLIGALP